MRLMLVGIDDAFFIKVAERLQEMNQPPSFLVGRYVDRERFPRTHVIHEEDLDWPSFYEEQNRHSAYTLSEELLTAMAAAEHTYLANSDRFAYWNISVRRRKGIYAQILLYWFNFLKTNAVDVLVFSSTPHMGWDNVLYDLARHLRIKTMYLERTCINDYVFFIEDFRKMDKVPEDYLAGRSREDVIRLLGKTFYQELRSESYWLRSAQKRSQLSRAFWKKLSGAAGVLGELLCWRGYVRKETPSAFFLNSSARRNFVILIEQLRKFRDRQLRNHYRRLCRPVNRQEPYVFFPLQFQPERTSIPLAGVFENQLLALEILAKSLPSGWKIVAKEHPRQLNQPRINGRHYRSRADYDRINAIPQVVLADIKESTEKLMETARFTATLTGSAGWESMLGGRACMVFGFPWYVGCRSCFRVHSVETCQEAIRLILNKKPDEVNLDVLRFLAFMKDRMILSTNSDYFAARSARDYDILVHNLAEAVAAQTVKEPLPA